MEKIVLKKSLFCFLAIIFVSFFNGKIYSSVKKPSLIKKGIPTHYEKKHNLSFLKLVHTIPVEFSKKYFFARPMELVVNKNGDIFIYDDLLNKIFKFKPDFTFDLAFGQVGQGPGDISPVRQFKSIGVYENRIILSDDMQKKIIIFNKDGKFIKEVRFPSKAHYIFPIIIPETNKIETPSNINPTKIGKLNYIVSATSKSGKSFLYKWNTNFNVIQRLLSENDYCRFIDHIPDTSNITYYMIPDFFNTCVKIIPKTQTLIVYEYNSSTVHIFTPGSPDFSFTVVPEFRLKSFKKNNRNLRKKLKDDNFFVTIFDDKFFVDQDRPKFIYFSQNADFDNGKKRLLLLYKFNLKGKLVKIFRINKEKDTYFMAKKNGYYFAIDHINNEINIFMEDKK